MVYGNPSGGSEVARTFRTLIWGCVTLIGVSVVCATVVAVTFWRTVPGVVENVFRGLHGFVDGTTGQPALRVAFSPAGYLDIDLAGGHNASQSVQRNDDVTRFELTTADGGEPLAKVSGVYTRPSGREVELAFELEANKPVALVITGLAEPVLTVDGKQAAMGQPIEPGKYKVVLSGRLGG